MTGEKDAAHSKALLFTLRLWNTHESAHAPQWRVRLQNIRSGEVYYCGDDKTLIALLDKLSTELLEDRK